MAKVSGTLRPTASRNVYPVQDVVPRTYMHISPWSFHLVLSVVYGLLTCVTVYMCVCEHILCLTSSVGFMLARGRGEEICAVLRRKIWLCAFKKS